jgi:hypothetical protein
MSPEEAEEASALDFHLERPVERRMGVSEANELKQLLHNRSVESVCHFFERIVVSIDCTPLTGLFDGGKVVLAGQQAHVVDLRNTRAN